MLQASFILSPVDPDFKILSEPAKSTKYNFPIKLNPVILFMLGILTDTILRKKYVINNASSE